MDQQEREDVIGKYFEIVDQEEYGEFESIYSKDIVWRSHGAGGKLVGLDTIITKYPLIRKSFDTTHEIIHQIHDDQYTVIIGIAEGKLKNEGAFKVEFVDVFEFDVATGLIRSITAYTRNL